MKNAERVAKEILELIGGHGNLKSVEHCATRLRFVAKDDSIIEANKDAIDNIDGVSGYFFANKQHQIILGSGFVNQVYAEINGDGEIQSNNKENVYEDLNIFQKLSRILGDVFVPIIPAIVAAGLCMGLANTLKFMGVMDDGSNLSLVIGILTDTAFVFLPAIVCWSAMKKFGGNPVLGIILGLMLVSSALPNAWEAAGGMGDVAPLDFNFGPLTIGVIGAQGQVLTPLVLGIIAAKFEKFLHRVVPSAIDLIVTPFVVLIVGLVLGLFVFGPILYQIEEMVAHGITGMLTLPLGIGTAILGFVNPLIVITGLHHSFGAIEIALIAETGHNYMNPAISAANIAMAGAALGAGLKLKNEKTKAMAYSSALTACFGITEPALFGVNLRFEKVLFAGMIAGAIGGLMAGVLGLSASGTGVTGLPGTLLYLDGNVFGYIITMVVTFVLATVLSLKMAVINNE